LPDRDLRARYIEQAHAADEFVTTAQLDACTAVLAKLAELLS
jgi:acetylornithine deacetylase/succinyl-diaminopimelate desuccinylase-like protein